MRKATCSNSGCKTIFLPKGPGGIKYQANGGHPNVDNPKLAARYFLNAIDKVNGLQENYKKKQAELEKEIPTLRELSQKTFEKENELDRVACGIAQVGKRDRSEDQRNTNESGSGRC